MTSTVSNIEADIVILGGGIQGIWLLADLIDQGYQALLLERAHPGYGQTGHSHFFLHRGHMRATMEKQENIGDAQRRIEPFQKASDLWENQLSHLRLRSVSPLKAPFYIGGNMRETSAGLLRVFKNAAVKYKEISAPPIFPTCNWMFQDEDDGICLESHAVLECLLDHKDLRSRIARCGNIQVKSGPTGELHLTVEKSDSDQKFEIVCQGLVLSAGAGNERLIQEILPASGIHTRQQTVKTYMLVVRDTRGSLGRICGMFPNHRNIFIAHRLDQDQNVVWLLANGQRHYVRASGEWTALDARSWFQNLKRPLKDLFPWILADPSRYQWGIYEATKAEPWTPNNGYPNRVKLPERHKIYKDPGRNIWVTWPSFLTLAPTAAGEIVQEINTGSIPRSTGIHNLQEWNGVVAKVTVGKDRWQTTPLLDWKDFSRCYA